MQNYINLRLGDPWLRIFSYLEVADILRLAQTSRTFAHLTDPKHLWVSIFRRDVLSRNLLFPVSCKDMEILDSSQVKMLVLHALQLNVHMTQQRPPAVIIPLHQPRSIDWVQIIRGRWLLVASSDSTCSVLSLWSIESLLSGRMSAIAAEACLDARISRGIVEAQDTQVIIALELRGNQSCIDVVTLANRDDKNTFVKLGRLKGASRIRALRGDLVGYGLHEERSIASIANWRTGAVHHLVRAPEMTGGCLGMAIDGEIAVMVTPVHVQVFRLWFSKDGGVRKSKLKRTLPIRHLVGFVNVAFRTPDAFIRTTKPTPTLHLFISGEGGLFVFVIFKDDLLLEDTDLDAFLVWHPSPEDPLYAREREKPALDDAVKTESTFLNDSEPQFGTDCATLSWIEGPYIVPSAKYPTNFVTLTSRLVLRGAAPAANAYYRIDGLKAVAFYAMASRDYDDGLGLLAVGNAFGELALYSLLPFEDLAAVYDALDDVPIPGHNPQDDTLSTIAPIRPSPVPNPYLFPPTSQSKPLEKWQAHEPSDVPDGWRLLREAPSRIWAHFLDNVWTIFWCIEHGFHFLGTATPVLCQVDFVLLKCGGLFFFYDVDEGDLLLVDRALDLKAILSRLGPNDMTLWTDLPLTKLRCDVTASKPPFRFQALWRWERRELGKDRWQEFEARGGKMSNTWWKGEKIFSSKQVILI